MLQIPRRGKSFGQCLKAHIFFSLLLGIPHDLESEAGKKALGWLWWRAWAGIGRRWRRGTLRGRRGTWRHPPSFYVAGVALGDIYLRFATPNFVTHTIFDPQLCHTPSLSHTVIHTPLRHPPSLTHHLSHHFVTHTHTPSFTHHFVTHHLWHTILHTQLCHTPSFATPSFTHHFVTHHLSHTTLSHTIFDTPSFTHHFVTHHLSPHHLSQDHLSHTTLSHTIFRHTIFCHTIFRTPLCHTPSFTHTQLCHTLSFTHHFHTHTHTHTIFHTQLCHTHHLSLSHTIFHIQLCHTHNFVYFWILHHLLWLSFLPRLCYNIWCSLLEEIALWGYQVLKFHETRCSTWARKIYVPVTIGIVPKVGKQSGHEKQIWCFQHPFYLQLDILTIGEFRNIFMKINPEWVLSLPCSYFLAWETSPKTDSICSWRGNIVPQRKYNPFSESIGAAWLMTVQARG